MAMMIGALAVDFVLLIAVVCFHTLLMFSFPLIVDRNLSALQAMKMSAKAVWKNLGGVVGIIGVYIVLTVSRSDHLRDRDVFSDADNDCRFYRRLPQSFSGAEGNEFQSAAAECLSRSLICICKTLGAIIKIILMIANFIKVNTTEELDGLFEKSSEQPVFLFKHSLTCPISAGVFEIVSGIDADVHLVVVQHSQRCFKRTCRKNRRSPRIAASYHHQRRQSPSITLRIMT